MTEILMIKLEDDLHPADADGYAAIRAIPENAMLKVNFSVPRNVRQLRLFFAMLKLIHAHQREPRQYATSEDLRASVLVAMGHCHEVRNILSGQVFTMPNSIAFGAMDQMQWKEFFDAFKRFVYETILPGVNSRDLDQQIADMLHEPGPDQLERYES